MKRYPLTLPAFGDESTGPRNRRGAFIVVAFFCLTACITFVAFSVDVGTISLTKTKMQNAVDAAALAAAMEITHAVENAGPDVSDLVEYSKTQAADKAVEVAALNGVYVDPTVDVEFGKRTYNGSTGKFEVTWNESPSNVVRVIARRDDPDVSKPDGQLQLFFAGVTGDPDRDDSRRGGRLCGSPRHRDRTRLLRFDDLRQSVPQRDGRQAGDFGDRDEPRADLQ